MVYDGIPMSWTATTMPSRDLLPKLDALMWLPINKFDASDQRWGFDAVELTHNVFDLFYP